MYKNTAAETRPELLAVVMEAQHADDKFIGEQLLPVYPSETRVGDYLRILKGEGGLLDGANDDTDELLRAPGTAYKRTGRSFSKDGFNCKDRGLVEPVDDTNAADIARFFDAESAAARLVHRNVRMRYEKRVKQQIFHATRWGTPLTPLVAYTTALQATVNFIEDMKTGIRIVGKRSEKPNVAAMNKNLWDYIQGSTLIRTFFFGANGGNAGITTELVAKYLGLAMILVAEASYSTAKKGATVTDAKLAYIWPDDYIWIGEVKGGAPEEGGAGRTFLWTGDSPELFTVESYRDEDIRSDLVRVRQDTDEKIVSEAAGVLIATGADLD